MKRFIVNSTRKNTLLVVFAILLAVGFISNIAKAGEVEMIAEFKAPSVSDNSLFTVDFRTGIMKFTGGWGDDKTGLTLEYRGTTFSNAWFDMTDVAITSTGTIPGMGKYGITGNGTINFYENGASTPLVTITFGSGLVSQFGFGADNEVVSNNVTITGLGIAVPLSEELFSFGFSKKQKLSGSTTTNDGFKATATLTSSAMVPEPATVGILAIGALTLLRRKK